MGLESRREGFHVPKGQTAIAQRFNVGFNVRQVISPEGTAEIPTRSLRQAKTQPSLRDARNAEPFPNVETLGYSRSSLRDNSVGARTPRISQLRVIGCSFLLLAFSLTSLGGTLTATLDRDTIGPGESAMLSVTVVGNLQSNPAVRTVPNLAISSAGTSQQYSIVNGRTSASLIYNYQIITSTPGDYTIPPITAVVDGANLATAPVTLKVVKTASNALSQFAFMRLIVPKNEIYVGEIIPIEVQLFVRSGKDLQRPQFKGDGFVVQKQAEPAQTRTQVGNAVFNVISFKMSVSAAKAGQLDLGPAECSLVLLIRQNSGRRDPFDSFADDFFGMRTEQRQVTLQSEAQRMNVLPIPRDKAPPGFSGALGKYAVSISASPTNVSVGDPITLRVRVDGQGSLDAMTLPELNWPNFKLYPAISTVTNTDVLGLQGSKTFEQVIVPQNSEVTEIPGVSFAFFDPEAKKFQVTPPRPIPIKVTPAMQAQAQPSVAAPAAKQAASEPAPARDIIHIKSSLGSISPLAPPLVTQTWFLALQGVPLFAWLAAFLWRKRREKWERDPRLRRRVQLEQTIKTGLVDLTRHAAASDTEQFFATVFHLLQEALGERLNLPASAITEAALDAPLIRNGATAELLAVLHELFLTCNQARYASSGARQEFASIQAKVEAALRQVQQLPAAAAR